MWLAKGLRSNIKMKSEIHYEWSTVESNTLVPRIMKRYFSAEVGTEKMCDLFLIEGVPCASFIYNKVNGRTVLEEFHINRGLMLLFDAGSCMRNQLYKHHPSIDLKAINNKNDLYF